MMGPGHWWAWVGLACLGGGARGLGEVAVANAAKKLEACAASTAAYVSCDLVDVVVEQRWPARCYRFGRASILEDGQLALTEGFDLPRCSVSRGSSKVSPGGRWCKYAPDGFEGRALLTQHPWAGNWQHFLFEFLPRIVFFYDVALEALGNVTAVVGPSKHFSGHPEKLEVLELAGIRQIEVAGARPDARGYDEVWTTSVLSENFISWTTVALAALNRVHKAALEVGKDVARGNRVVYFTRKDAAAGTDRAMVNEQKLVAAFRAHGVDVAEFTSYPTLKARIRALRDYSLIITPFGAAAANVLFSDTSTTWLFLCPPTMCKPNERDYLKQLAVSLGASPTALRYTDHTHAAKLPDVPSDAAADKDNNNRPYEMDVASVLRLADRIHGAR